MQDILSSIWEALPFMLSGVWVNAVLIVGAMLLGLALGTPLAVFQVYGAPWARRLVGLYVWAFRGVPILVQLYLFYFGILNWLASFESLAWANLDSPFFAAILVLGLTSAAYQSQIFRGAILAIPVGQFKAARALGMSDATAIRCIILPQALRLSIPGWSNEYSILLKDSALAFALGVMEVMSRTRAIATVTHQPLPLSILAGLIFFAMTWVGVKSLRLLEKKVRIPGYSH